MRNIFLVFLSIFILPKVEAQISKCNFTYNEIQGLGYEKGVARENPSDIIRYGNKYYIFYTKQSLNNHTSSIWFASSRDQGYTWTEEKELVPSLTSKEGAISNVSSPYVIKDKGQFVLYYTQCTIDNNKNANYSIETRTSKSLKGPFTKESQIQIIKTSDTEMDFDSYSIDDPSVIVRNDSLFLYYKAKSIQSGINRDKFVQTGLAISTSNNNEFKKVGPLNFSTSQQISIWPYKGKMVAFRSDPEAIIFSNDGIVFDKKTEILLTDKPISAGIYRKDLSPKIHIGTENDKWGVSVIKNGENSYLTRFSIKVM